ncbi:MAG: hypothetical protein ACK5T3_12940 [Betaproteobacteria bacterium]
MAVEDRNQPNPAINIERLDLARQAAIVVCQIAGPLQYLTAGHADAELDTAHQLAIRIEELASVMLTALNDQGAAPDTSLAEARATLLGPEFGRRRGQDPVDG